MKTRGTHQAPVRVAESDGNHSDDSSPEREMLRNATQAAVDMQGPPPSPSVTEFLMTQQAQQANRYNEQQAVLIRLLTTLQGRAAMPPGGAIADHSFLRLASYDPDSSHYSMREWLDDASALRADTNASDVMMLNRASDALRGRARDFMRAWRPLQRTWAGLVEDLLNTFPNQKSFGVLIREATEMTSSNFKTLSEYGALKVRLIKRILPQLSWANILSMIEDGITDAYTQSSLGVQQPANEAALFQLLSTSDARRRQNRKRRRSSENTRRPQPSSPKAKHPKVMAESTCFRCGKRGHRQSECRSAAHAGGSSNNHSRNNDNNNMVRRPPTLTPCEICKKPGHSKERCWFRDKSNVTPREEAKPAKAMLIGARRSLSETPIATCIANDRSIAAVYVVDSGADLSLVTEDVVKRMAVKIHGDPRQIVGLGSRSLCTLGTCHVVLVLPSITLEATLHVIQTGSLPGGLQLIIGWDLIGMDHVKVIKSNNRLELHHSLLATVRNDTLRKPTSIKLPLESSGLAEREIDELQQLIAQLYRERPAQVTTGSMKIILRDEEPVAYRPRRLAYAERVITKNIIDQLLKEDIIQPSESPYASPIVLVRKKDGSTRMCVDFRDLNKKVVRDRYPLPLIQDQINALCGANFFTTLDMKNGFHQVLVEESSRPFTAFITPDGHYEYRRMPFGLTNAPSCYQRAIDRALGPLKGTDAYVYLDDVLIPSATRGEGVVRLKKVLTALISTGFGLNLDKCTFFKQETEYLGVVISAGSVRPSPNKISALQASPVPKNVHEVRQFIGLASYFRRFIQGFAQQVVPITRLLRNNVKFEWTSEHEAVRQKIVTTLTTEPTLRIFNPDLPTEVHTDASSIGIGGVLLQGEQGQMKPVAYYGRQTTDCETRYHSYDLETLAVVEAVEHFRVYLYGRHFTVYTDCNSVRATALKKDLHPRVARWWMKLQDYDFDIEYRPGSKMAHVDYLSRNPVVMLASSRDDAEKTLKQYQHDDPFYDRLKQGDLSTEYQLKDDMIITTQEPVKYWVPPAARLVTMRKYHDAAAHVGKDKVLAKLREELHWNGMGQSLKKYIQNCRVCALSKSHTGKLRGTWQKQTVPTAANQVWHMDHAGPLPKSNGNTQILVIIDSFSKHCTLCPVQKKTTESAIQAIEKVFEQNGKPDTIVADRGTGFTSSRFKQFVDEHGIKLQLIPTGMPRANGQVERVMRHLFNLLRASLDDAKGNTWANQLPLIQNVMNNTIQSSVGCPPNAIAIGEVERLEPTKQLLGDAPKLLSKKPPAAEEITARLEALNSLRREKFNKTRAVATPFEKGMRVVVKETQLSKGGKLGRPYRGPYEITQVLPNERYVVQLKGRRTATVAHEHLRAWPAEQRIWAEARS